MGQPARGSQVPRALPFLVYSTKAPGHILYILTRFVFKKEKKKKESHTWSRATLRAESRAVIIGLGLLLAQQDEKPLFTSPGPRPWATVGECALII